MKSIRYYADDSFSIRKLKGVAADLNCVLKVVFKSFYILL